MNLLNNDRKVGSMIKVGVSVNEKAKMEKSICMEIYL
jgi:hypothetical protein